MIVEAEAEDEEEIINCKTINNFCLKNPGSNVGVFVFTVILLSANIQ